MGYYFLQNKLISVFNINLIVALAVLVVVVIVVIVVVFNRVVVIAVAVAIVVVFVVAAVVKPSTLTAFMIIAMLHCCRFECPCSRYRDCCCCCFRLVTFRNFSLAAIYEIV